MGAPAVRMAHVKTKRLETDALYIGGIQITGTSSVSGSVSLSKPIANRCMLEWHGLTDGATNLGGTSRTAHPIAGVAAANGIRLVYFGGGLPTGLSAEQINPNALPIMACIEDPHNGSTIWQATFSGNSQGILSPGGYLRSDPMGVDVYAGDTLYVRTYVLLTNGQKMPVGHYTALSGEGHNYGSSVNGANLTAPGSGAVPTAGFQYVFGPHAIEGVATSFGKTGVKIGDSIMTGIGYSPNDTSFPDLTLGTSNALISLGFPGDSAAHAATSRQLRQAFLASLAGKIDFAICNFGTNDFFAGATFPQWKTNIQAIWASLQALGVQRIIQTTITPRSTSGNGWIDTSQVPVTGFSGANSPRGLANTFIRSLTPLNSPIYGVWDVCQQCENNPTLQDGIWVPNATADGIHPNPAMYQAIAAAAASGNVINLFK